VSRGLVDVASSDELAAVLTHEQYHVANLDPLKIVLARVLSSAYFFLPALRGLRARYSAASELAADRTALLACGRASLAGALHQVVRGPDWSELHIAAAIGGAELLELRIAQMEANEEPEITAVPKWAMVLTSLALVAFASVVFGTIAAIGGPGAMGRQMMGRASDGMGMSVADSAAGLLPWVLLASVAALAWHRSQAAYSLQ
jgi:beta-lactamase regulating signal transducer with metallopeptidase domain